MPIRIIKKRHVPPQREPATLVPDPETAPVAPAELDYDKRQIAKSIEELWANRATMRAPAPTVCSLCGHLYGFPCHGKNDSCMNARWAGAAKEA
ncbi:hypothetical protein [Sinorhizobium fredii]|uniref:hypothetical protein n=1 Tax=Rhizobium fredii TaxID=380 RepID=UPI0012959538|nr:hypothetical protein [Sinorhizobium fredii]MQW94108.1 hypothetical protein [Sinorhizobium fredii]